MRSRGDVMKNKLLEILEEQHGGPILGSELAARLEVSRNTIGRLVKELRHEGYIIQAAPNRGYSLLNSEENLNVTNLHYHMQTEQLGRDIRVFRSIDSTNTAVKELAGRGVTDGLLVVAEEQTAGRGRFGKSFYSPPSTGIYMSFFVRPLNATAYQTTMLTIMAGVAVVEAIDILTGLQPKIKWVNDILVRDRKVCGILVEAITPVASQQLIGAVVGIGINLDTVAFPEELQGTAGSLSFGQERRYTRSQMIATILARFEQWYLYGHQDALLDFYRQRSAVLGQTISYTVGGKTMVGQAVDIDEQGGLVVRDMSNGKQHTLDSGEISIRPYRGGQVAGGDANRA